MSRTPELYRTPRKPGYLGGYNWRATVFGLLLLVLVLEAVGEGTKMADHGSPGFRPAFPSLSIILERSSPSRVRFAAPNNGAPLTAPGRSRQHP